VLKKEKIYILKKLVVRNYWWLGVIKDVKNYVDGCDICQRIKNYIEALAEKLMANGILKKPWIHLIVEFITKLLLVAENDVILVVCNRLSKIVYFVTTTEGISVEELVRLFSNNIWKLYGLLENVILDREPQFVVKLTKELNRMLGIEMKLLISFHPQIDGQTKYINQELEHYLWFFINHRKKNWLEWLVTV